MVDDAGGHEQRRLEDRVIHHVEDGGDLGQRRTQAEQQRDEAQLADGAVGQQPLQVVLEQRDIGPEEHGHEPDAADRPEPLLGACQHRPEPHQQEDAGLYHRRRMQVGADRCRRRHRVRQPEVERELRRLGECPEQDQGKHEGISWVGADQVAGRKHGAERVAPDDVADQQHGRKQRQSPGAGDEQCQPRSLAGFGGAAPETDQQEGTQAGQFPENQQQEQVVRGHDAEHRAHEEQQVGEEAAVAILVGEVVVRVEDDQQADADDQAGKQQRQAVEAQGDIESHGRDPLEALQYDLAGDDMPRLDRDQPGRAGCDQARRRGRRHAHTLERRRQQREDEWQEYGCREQHQSAPAPSVGGEDVTRPRWRASTGMAQAAPRVAAAL
jgi:hypothetical protein